MDKCMPTSPVVVGREFVKKYYTILYASPESLYCFYTDSASFTHDETDPNERRTIVANGKMAIRDALLARLPQYKQAKAKVSSIETIKTLNDCLAIQVVGEISYNDQPMRPFSQTIILVQVSPFHYFVQNDIFRFSDFDSNDEQRPYEPIHKTLPTSESVQGCETMPMEADCGTQCADYIEPSVTLVEKCTSREVIVTGAPENEVKLDTSDSGLSSDATVDVQVLNVMNTAKDTRTITNESATKRIVSTPSPIAQEITAPMIANDEMPENKSQLLRDSSILTIGNILNPNIEYDDAKCGAEMNKSENENVCGRDGVNSGKGRNHQRKDKLKSEDRDISIEKSLSDSNIEKHTNGSKIESNDDRPTVVNQNMPSECTSENIVEKSSKSEPKTATDTREQQTSEPIVKKSYADLAKSGTAEWIDEMANHRSDSTTDKLKSRSTLPRRNSRNDKGTQSNEVYSRMSPNNDQMQVFIGNIPHSADEDDIRRMFSRFGRLIRVRFHSNIRKEWLPRYAFITYDNIQSAQQCLMKKNEFYWPENGFDRQKLNVNGDPSVDIWDENGNQRLNDARGKSCEFKRSSKNSVFESKQGNNSKRSPSTNTEITDAVKNERRNTLTRA